MDNYIISIGKRAKKASCDLNKLSTNQKNEILLNIKNALIKNIDTITTANQKDLDIAKENGMSQSLMDRLMLNETRIKDIANSIDKIIMQDDPIGVFDSGKTMPNGLQILTKRVPLGVIGIIYESRPNVTVDTAVLCIKSSNAVILRGGKEAINTNIALANVMRTAIHESGYNQDIIILIEDISREISNQMMKLNGYLDVLIPRGGAGLIKAVIENSTVPVIETGTGNCHIYIDNNADFDMATEIVYNAKCSRPSVCNACESLLIHKDVAKELLPQIADKLWGKDVLIKGCENTIEVLGDRVELATDEDYYTEFLDYIISIKVVDDVQMAIDHISKYTSGHSECIITKDINNANVFTTQIDAAAVYVNASTRFTDGGEFGLGAEVGISTQKLHARGPMGITALTTIKYIITGNGQIR